MTMIERMAKALQEEIAKPEYEALDSVPGEDVAERLTLGLARAALAAAREPTEAMVKAATDPYRHGNTAEFDAIFAKTVGGYWQAMIDAALEEGK